MRWKNLLSAGILFGLFALLAVICIDWEACAGWFYTLPKGIRETAFVLANTVQIVFAFLPGEPLELAAGYLFGAEMGTLICLFGSALGTLAIWVLVKLFQRPILHFFFQEEKLREWETVMRKHHGYWWMFLLFLIPGSPKDLMTYTLALKEKGKWKWTFLITIGRIPSIITSTYLSGSVAEQNYILAGSVFLITMLLVGSGITYLRYLKGAKRT